MLLSQRVVQLNSEYSVHVPVTCGQHQHARHDENRVIGGSGGSGLKERRQLLRVKSVPHPERAMNEPLSQI